MQHATHAESSCTWRKRRRTACSTTETPSSSSRSACSSRFSSSARATTSASSASSRCGRRTATTRHLTPRQLAPLPQAHLPAHGAHQHRPCDQSVALPGVFAFANSHKDLVYNRKGSSRYDNAEQQQQQQQQQQGEWRSGQVLAHTGACAEGRPAHRVAHKCVRWGGGELWAPTDAYIELANYRPSSSEQRKQSRSRQDTSRCSSPRWTTRLWVCSRSVSRSPVAPVSSYFYWEQKTNATIKLFHIYYLYFFYSLWNSVPATATMHHRCTLFASFTLAKIIGKINRSCDSAQVIRASGSWMDNGWSDIEAYARIPSIRASIHSSKHLLLRPPPSKHPSIRASIHPS